MSISLDQARAFDAFARHGTFEGAAEALHKGHTAVMYALRTMEQQLELKLLDRSGYRTKITAVGERVLEEARAMLAAEHNLQLVCAELRSGWEPRVRIVFDGICPTDAILNVVRELARAKAKTRVDVSTSFLAGVEAAFLTQEADIMISIMPAASPGLVAANMPKLRAFLVAHKSHPLARKHAATRDDLAAEVLLTVRGSDPRLQLSTSGITPSFAVELNDFSAKKVAILSGMGFGWMPEHLIESELAKGTLQKLRWRGASEHHFQPRLYHRARPRLGRAAQFFVDRLGSD